MNSTEVGRARTMPAPDCLSEDEIVVYCSGTLTAAARRRVDLHIDRCGECRELITEFMRGWHVDRTASPGDEGEGESDEFFRGEGPIRVGRYLLRERIGAGGMGVVHAGYDPQLGRRIALKLIAAPLAEEPQARARMLREAQAMALLSHANVVAIHDAGIHEGRVWLAMEFVDGITLGAWLRARPRRWREVLAMFVAAGDGLVAAHAAGLVHRDFKPDNVLVGSDGRPRVMDFGLARGSRESIVDGVPEVAGVAVNEPLTRGGAMLGTPRYMAPEQWLGREVDARTDAYAFCVALWEALYGEHPFSGETAAALADAVIHERVRPPRPSAGVPVHVRRALRRGLASEPADRFSTLAELLAALRRDVSRRNRRIVLLVLLVGVIAGVLGWREVDRQGRIAACSARAGEIGAVWNPARRTGVERKLTNDDAVSQDRFVAIVRQIDAYAAAWSTVQRDACTLAQVEHTLAPDAYERVEACLEERKLGLDVALEALDRGGAAARERIGGIILALRPPTYCRDPARLDRQPPPPPALRAAAAEVRRGVLRVPLLLADGSLVAAETEARAAKARAAELARPQLRALAAMASADVALHRGELEVAYAQLVDAVHVAGASGADELAAEAAWTLVELAVSHRGDAASGRVWARQAEMWWTRLGRVDTNRAAVELALAKVHLGEGDDEAALAAMERALVLYGHAEGDRLGEVAALLIDRANLLHRRGAHARAYADLSRALAIHVRLHGADDTRVADALYNLASLAESLDAHASAAEQFRRALAIYTAHYGPEHADVGDVWGRLGRAELTRGELAAAERCFAQAGAIAGADPDRRRALEAVALAGLGEIRLARGETAAALAALERVAATELADVEGAHLKFALARALMAAGRDKGRAIELSREAGRLYRDSWQSAPSWRAAVEQWTAAHASVAARG